MIRPFSICRLLMAKYYDHAMKKMEYGGMEFKRRELLADTYGEVLELGAGTGLNLRHYPEAVTGITLTEPDPYMNRELAKKTQQGGSRLKHIIPCQAEKLEAENHSFDCVVATLVFCSVQDPEQALSEVKRILKPGGRLFFIEHVLAEKEPELITWQRRWEPLWVRCGGNCHLTRPTATTMMNAGLAFDKLEHPVLQKVPGVVKHAIQGIASVAI
jgi:ubiquinone/menaquinone biosynthesis C-methylase UbiE